MAQLEENLPAALLKQADFNGENYAWPLAVVPQVIEAARTLNLLCTSGNVALRWDGQSYACPRLSISPEKGLPDHLPWRKRVDRAAEAALEQFEALCDEENLLLLCTREFPEIVSLCEAGGGKPAQALWFLLPLVDEKTYAAWEEEDGEDG